MRDNRPVGSDLSVGKQTCANHADRPAIDRCSSCGRTVCLGCAVPVRGSILCTGCAAREIGEPAPSVPVRTTTRLPEAIAGAALALALLGTVPPWDRFGALTAPFSAWRTTPSPWPLLATLALVVAAAAVVLPAVRGRGATRATAVAYATFSTLAAGLVAWQVFGSPDYVAHTPAPYAVMTLAFGAALVGALRLRHLV